MRDWNALVREHLKLADLSPGQQDETIAELASHLGDLCEEYRAQGLNESEAVRRALEEVTDWRHLAGTIQRAKRKEGSMTDRTMNDRTKHLWLPGLVSFSAAMILLAILIQISLQPRYLGRSPLYMVFLPWLALLPLCGAAGAYLSRRGGGYLAARLASGLFPTIVLLILGTILTVTRLVVFIQPRWWYGSLAIAFGVVLPSAALLLGTVPFLRATKPQP